MAWNVPFRPPFWFGVFGAFLPVGAILVIIGLAWGQGKLSPQDMGFAVTGIIIALLAAACCVVGWNKLRSADSSEDDSAAERLRLYNTYLVGTGYALLFSGLVCCVLVGGLLYSTRLECTGPEFEAAMKLGTANRGAGEHVHAPVGAGPSERTSESTPPGAVTEESAKPAAPSVAPEAGSSTKLPAPLSTAAGSGASDQRAVEVPRERGVRLATLILLSMGASVVGALFFVANSLREKCATGEQFSAGRFWGGLWYRLGEAVLFSLVMFWLVWRGSAAPVGKEAISYTWLPIMSLLLGMFVKSGEALIFAIAQGLFKAVAAFFGLTMVTPVTNTGELGGGAGSGGGGGQGGGSGDGAKAGSAGTKPPPVATPKPTGAAVSTLSAVVQEPPAHDTGGTG